MLMGAMIHYFKVQPFIATLAGLFLFRGLSLMLTKQSIPINDETVASIAQFHISLPAEAFLSVGAAISIVVVAVVVFVLHYSRFGRQVYAIGGHEQSALLMGLPVVRTKIGLYTLSGALAGFAGVLTAAYLQSGVTVLGVGTELDAISVVVIGGTLLTGGAGTIIGTLVGVLLRTLIQNVINQIGTLDSSYQTVVSGAFLLVVVVIQRLLARSRTR
jgi:ribose transport system permease protein